MNFSELSRIVTHVNAAQRKTCRHYEKLIIAIFFEGDTTENRATTITEK